jgi:hypothetical protein
MAKKNALPKVISQANKDISTIIETDIAKESALLKDLVDQVLKANLEVKKKNNMRITETKRKLAELDDQIDSLNSEIDLVDRETIIEQLNEMIDAENKIFNAKQEIRFFSNAKLPDRIQNLERIYNELMSSGVDLSEPNKLQRDTLLNSNVTLINKQLDITNKVLQEMKDSFALKQENINKVITSSKELQDKIASLEQQLLISFTDFATSYFEAIQTNASTFSMDTDDDAINKALLEEHNENLKNINQKKEDLRHQYETDKQTIIDQFNGYVETIRQDLEKQNEALLQQEKAHKDKLESDIKQLRLEILNAERSNNYDKISGLMKKIEKIEKQLDNKTDSKVSKQLDKLSKKERIKTNKALTDLEIQFVKDLNQINYDYSFEGLDYEEAKILRKIKVDYDGMSNDLDHTKTYVKQIKDILEDKNNILKDIASLKLDIRLSELAAMKQNEYIELELISTFNELVKEIKVIEEKRSIILKQSTNNQEIIKVNEEYKLKKAILDMKLDQDITEIDKRILQKQNETLIKNEKLKEEMNSEILYQESLIKIAQKEHELQLIKVKSLYENERNLAEEQVERINLGVKVNDTFVKTTLQNQLLFAQQQINCADSEFDIRVESINLTHDQEVKYATKKIEYYRQKYEYEKSKYQKELDDKLEDLNYKLLLFTSDKDNKEITKKIEDLKSYYNSLIREIEDKEYSDPEIVRYEKVINDADNRANKAISEAQALREQTIGSFQTLFNQTKEKYDTIVDLNQTEETKGIMPLINNNAISSADERLQKAIKEADELLEDRMLEPTNIISELKHQLEDLTNTDDTDQFVEDQKEQKKYIILQHQDTVSLLEKEFHEQLLPLKEQQTKLVSELDTIEIDEEAITASITYRSEEDIENDYKELIQKEELRTKEFLMELEENKKARFTSLENTLKHTTDKIKLVLKPYKTYISGAAKEVNSKKKSLTKEYKKILKKELKEAKTRLNDEIMV